MQIDMQSEPGSLGSRATIVGRAAELAQLEDALTQAEACQGSVLVLAGEAGIGKSRLVAETKRRATSRGFALLEGAAFAPDRTVPYAPLLDMLRSHVTGRAGDELRDVLGPTAPELLRLAPELSARLSDLVAPPSLEADVEFTVHCSGGGPLLVVVEDLHWADDASLEFLLVLARRIARQPILLLLTYRDDDLQPALENLLAELNRGRLASFTRLRRLTPAETDTMLRGIFSQDRPIRADFLEMIHGLTDGNPFFVEEVVTSLVAAGDIFWDGQRWDRRPIGELRVPGSVQDAVSRRVDQLAESTRRTLTLAALIGRRFDFGLLQELTAAGENTLVTEVRALIDAGLVVEESADRFAFRHALTRDAAAARLLARERRGLHRRIAEAMERLPGHAAPADLAAHFAGAELWEKALEYAALAGEQAREMDAPRSAAAHFTFALEAAAALHLEPPAALLQARGEALETIGDFEAARSDFEAALASGRAAADSSVEWQALLSLGMLWSSRDYSRAGDYLREALDCARAINDPGRVAQSLNRAGNWHLNSGRPEEARRLHEEALTNFGELNDRRGRAQTLDLLGMAVNLSGDTAAAVACYEQAAALFRDLSDRMGLASTLGNLAAAPAEHLTFPVAVPPSYRPEECAREALAFAREIGWRAGEAYALANLATLLATRGEYKEALACARQAEATVEEIEHHQWRTAMTFGSGMVCFDLLYLAGARRHLEAALAQARSLGSSYWERHIGGILAWTLVLVGELERAEQIIEDLFPREERSGLLWQMEVRVRCELALAKGDAPGALAYADRLLDAAQRSVPGAVVAAIGLPRGAALAALGRDEEAEVVLRAALDACVTQPLRWRLHVALGRFYQARGRRLDADGEFAAARAIVDQLATLLPDEPVPEFFGASPRVEFLRGAATIIPRQRPVTPLRAARDAAGGLTARERDVAALIARGCSNREIANALVIGHRTVQTHVENIFAKLGCSSRAEVAVWAAAKGLLNHTGRT